MRIASPMRRIAVVAAVVVGSLATAPAPSEAAGVQTHGWMAVSAIPKVDDPALRTLLEGHLEQVRAGGMFPDAGYVLSNTFGEEAHWQRFVDNYTARILARDDCGDITAPNGPCADMVAHLMGVAAHGMGDEVWDWLFEPYSPDLNEHYTDPSVALFNESGIEAQMDVVAIGVHGVPRPQVPALPSIPTLISSFEDGGLFSVTPAQLSVQGLGEFAWDLESSYVPGHLGPIQAAMPWTSSNMVTAPGGVDFAATAIAGYWETIWGELVGDRPATRVSITHPAPGQDDLPTTGWDRSSFDPGSSRGRGGARNRITAVLTSSMPYRRPGGVAVSNQLAAGTMTITDRQTGTAVPIKAGYPKIVPYTADPGEHLIDVQPASNLAACRWYDVAVGVTTPLMDNRGAPITPHRWSFRTECTGNALTGTATGPDGAPVGDAWVLAYRPSDGYGPSGLVKTGPDGNWAMPGLPADASYRVGVVPPVGSGLATGIAPGTFAVNGSPVTVDVVLPALRDLTGTVLDASGAPVVGAEVAVLKPTDTWVPSFRTTTGAGGSFAIADLPEGTYTVAYRSAPGTPWWFHERTTVRPRATPVALGADPVTLTLRFGS